MRRDGLSPIKTTIIAVFSVFVAYIASCERGEEPPSGDDDIVDDDVINDDDTNDDDTSDCYENGVPFLPLDGTTDPWLLETSDYCCSEAAQTITIYETEGKSECESVNPTSFVCLSEAGDGLCETSENFCTSPLDCLPPSGNFELCCGEGDVCMAVPDWSNSGVSECCDGLTMVNHSVWDDTFSECMQSGTATICNRCGNGDCGIGENVCNCPEDCTQR